MPSGYPHSPDQSEVKRSSLGLPEANLQDAKREIPAPLLPLVTAQVYPPSADGHSLPGASAASSDAAPMSIPHNTLAASARQPLPSEGSSSSMTMTAGRKMPSHCTHHRHVQSDDHHQSHSEEKTERKDDSSDFDSKIGTFTVWLMSFGGQAAVLNDIVSFILLDIIRLAPCFDVTLGSFIIALGFALIIASLDTWFHSRENFINEGQNVSRIDEAEKISIEKKSNVTIKNMPLGKLDYILLFGHRTDDVLSIAGAPAGFMELISSVFNKTIPLGIKVAVSCVGLLLGVLGSKASQRNAAYQLQRYAFWEQLPKDANNNSKTSSTTQQKSPMLAPV